MLQLPHLGAHIIGGGTWLKDEAPAVVDVAKRSCREATARIRGEKTQPLR